MEERATVELGIEGLSRAVHLGTGGSAQVYAATDAKTGETVAVKLLRAAADSESARRRFDRERVILERLSAQGGIVPILGSGLTDRGEPYFLMPVMSSSLQEELDENGAMHWATAAQLIIQIADSVAYAHGKNVLHRDLKPGNILLGEDGIPQVSDFGIAKLTDNADSKSSRSLGTPAFMPPERFDAAAPTEATDIYGLAATFAALVLGTPPFTTGEGDTDAAVVRRVLMEEPPDLTDVDVPEPVAELIRRSMSKDPDSRPPSAAEFVDQMRRALAAEGVTATEPMTIAMKRSAGARLIDPAPTHDERRGRLRVLAPLAAVVLLLLAGLGVAAAQLRGTDDPEVLTEVKGAVQESTTGLTVADGSSDEPEPEATDTSSDQPQSTESPRSERRQGDPLDPIIVTTEPLAETTTTTTTTATTSPPRPAAACVNASHAEVEPDEAVAFTNCSTLATSYAWDFGDGQTSSLANPSHSWSATGTYTVRLTASGAGGSDSASVSISVTEAPEPPDPPEACFRLSTTSVDVGQSLSFTNCSTAARTYSWDFSDGSTSSSSSPRHSFRAAGTYTVRLTATGPGGTDMITRQVTVKATPPPDACFQAASEADVGVPVRFTNCSTGASTYQWSFGSSLTNPSYTFTSAGTFIVRLTASGSGGTDTASKSITVQAAPVKPTACFRASTYEAIVGTSISFTNCSSNATTYEWDFGDGSAKSTSTNPTHTFTSAAAYTVRLKATGPGGTHTTSKTVDVIGEVEGPVACFDASPNPAGIGETVSFENCSSKATSYEWDFGDGSTSTESNPNHTYSESGSYTVELTARGEGAPDTATGSIEVAGAPVVACFEATPNPADVNEPVSFTNCSTGATSYEWDFGDGNSSVGVNPTGSYSFADTYTVRLTAFGPAGTDSTWQDVVVIRPTELPVACFVVDHSQLYVGEPVTFTNCSTDATFYFWQFSGGISTEESPTHVFDSEGPYAVYLTASSPDGDDTIVKEIYVVAHPSPP